MINSTRTFFAAIACGLFVAGAAEAQEFGGTVVLNEGRILISEPIDPEANPQDPATSAPRSLYVYERAGSGWEHTGTLRAPEHGGADFFGRFILADGDRLLVGATALDQNGDGQSDGSVLIYRRSADGWEFERHLRPESVPFGSSFGRFASLAGDLLVVTALAYQGSGGAWVFERGDDGEWVEQGILTPSDPDPQLEFFGWGAHTDGRRVIVGAFAGPQRPGAARTRPGGLRAYRPARRRHRRDRWPGRLKPPGQAQLLLAAATDGPCQGLDCGFRDTHAAPTPHSAVGRACPQVRYCLASLRRVCANADSSGRVGSRLPAGPGPRPSWR